MGTLHAVALGRVERTAHGGDEEGECECDEGVGGPHRCALVRWYYGVRGVRCDAVQMQI